MPGLRFRMLLSNEWALSVTIAADCLSLRVGLKGFAIADEVNQSETTSLLSHLSISATHRLKPKRHYHLLTLIVWFCADALRSLNEAFAFHLQCSLVGPKSPEVSSDAPQITTPMFAKFSQCGGSTVESSSHAQYPSEYSQSAPTVFHVIFLRHDGPLVSKALLCDSTWAPPQLSFSLQAGPLSQISSDSEDVVLTVQTQL